MNAILRAYVFYLSNPETLLLHAGMTFSALWILGMAIFVLVAARRDRQAQHLQQRKREFDAAMALTHDLGKRGPAGFQRRVG